LGNVSLDEGPKVKLVKTKLRKKPVPHYLRGTNASKAMQRPKSPLSKTKEDKRGKSNKTALSRLAAGKPI